MNQSQRKLVATGPRSDRAEELSASTAAAISGPRKTVRLTELSISTVCARAGGIDDDWVGQLMELGGDWPPILVTKDLHVVDGHHRVVAARRLRKRTIAVEELSELDGAAALVEAAATANAFHGLPLTRADRRCIVDRLLQLAPEWSDRRIAAAAGVSPTTVGTRRRAMQPLAPAEAAETRPDVRTGHLNVRVGRDGKKYPAPPRPPQDARPTTGLLRRIARRLHRLRSSLVTLLRRHFL